MAFPQARGQLDGWNRGPSQRTLDVPPLAKRCATSPPGQSLVADLSDGLVGIAAEKHGVQR
jgi:hypothetical protein